MAKGGQTEWRRERGERREGTEASDEGEGTVRGEGRGLLS